MQRRWVGLTEVGGAGRAGTSPLPLGVGGVGPGSASTPFPPRRFLLSDHHLRGPGAHQELRQDHGDPAAERGGAGLHPPLGAPAHAQQGPGLPLLRAGDAWGRGWEGGRLGQTVGGTLPQTISTARRLTSLTPTGCSGQPAQPPGAFTWEAKTPALACQRVPSPVAVAGWEWKLRGGDYKSISRPRWANMVGIWDIYPLFLSTYDVAAGC